MLLHQKCQQDVWYCVAVHIQVCHDFTFTVYIFWVNTTPALTPDQSYTVYMQIEWKLSVLTVACHLQQISEKRLKYSD